MSAVTKRSRPTKPKTTVEAVPTPAVTPAVSVPAPAPAVPAAAPAPANETDTKRQQIGKAVGILINPARVKHHLNKLNLNKTVDGQIKSLKQAFAPYTTAKVALETKQVTVQVESEVDGKKTMVKSKRDATPEELAAFQATVERTAVAATEFEKKLSALSRERTRFSSEAPIVLAIICDELIQQLTEHTMDKALAAKKKIIQISHLHEEGIENIPLYPLIKSLPSFVKTAENIKNDASKEADALALATALAQAEKDFKKKYNIHTPREKKAVAAPVVATVAAPVAEENEPDSNKTSFKFYVGLVCAEVAERDSAKYGSVRISTEIRVYLSDLLVEMIHRVANFIKLLAFRMKNKTIDEAAVLRAVEALLNDGHDVVESIEFKEDTVHDPELLKIENNKKVEEKKQGRSYKVDLSKIPMVQTLVATRQCSYPTSGFAALESKVTDKLEQYRALAPKKKPADA